MKRTSAAVVGLGELTATAQSCISLWENGLGLADVFGSDFLDRRTLAMIGRSLALRGEALFLIADRLIPCSDWDLSTRNGRPAAYRVSISEAGGGRTLTALAAEVLARSDRLRFCGSLAWYLRRCDGRASPLRCCTQSKAHLLRCTNSRHSARKSFHSRRPTMFLWSVLGVIFVAVAAGFCYAKVCQSAPQADRRQRRIGGRFLHRLILQKSMSMRKR